MTGAGGSGGDDDATEVVPVVPDPVADEVPPADEGDGGGFPNRRGRLIGAIAVLLLLVGALVVVSAGDDDGVDVASEDREPTTTSVSTTTSSTSSTTTTVLDETTTTAKLVVAEPEDPGEPPAQRRCVEAGGGPATPPLETWQSSWQTQPQPNDPVTMRLCISDVTPIAGQTVQVTLVADDPDAVILQENCGYLVEFESDGMGNLCRDALIPPNGPRPTPAEEPGHIAVTFDHTYAKVGTFTLSASVISARWEGYRTPYSSYADASFDVTVHS